MTRFSSLVKATAFLLLAAVGGIAVIGFRQAPNPQPTAPPQVSRAPSPVGAVKFLLHRIYQRTGVPNRTALVAALRSRPDSHEQLKEVRLQNLLVAGPGT